MTSRVIGLSALVYLAVVIAVLSGAPTGPIETPLRAQGPEIGT